MRTETMRDALDKLEVVDREAVKEPNPRSSPKRLNDSWKG